MNIEDLYTDAFEKYFELLIDWNKKFNLTAITDRSEVFLKHFYDSVLPAHLLPQGARVLDIGAGAGFPSIPLKLVRPDLEITMLDSVNKKVRFLQEVVGVLGLAQIDAIHCRIEDFFPLKGKADRAAYDVVTSRAVAPLNILAEYSLPFARLGGFMLAYKSTDSDDEIAAAAPAVKKLGGIFDRIIDIPLCEGITRRFIILKKVSATDGKYPRSLNKPRLDPL